MQIVFALVALVVGFVLLVKGADWFVEGSAGIANKFGIPQIVIGLTIVAMGTSMPEAAVSISAALRGSAEITIGNVVGSNIMNILVILGLTAVVCQIAVQKTTIHYEIPMVIGVTILLAVMGLQNNIISRAEGVILLACMVVYMLYLLRLAKRGVVENEEMDAYAKQVSFGRLILLVVVGVAAIIFGSHVAVEAASAIARIFGISERFIGLTIVAFGTSLPELVTTLTAIRKKESSLSVGNIIGANIMDLTLIMPLCSLIQGRAMLVERQGMLLDIPGCLIICAAALVPALASGRFKRWIGFLIGGLYIVYLVVMFVCFGA